MKGKEVEIIVEPRPSVTGDRRRRRDLLVKYRDLDAITDPKQFEPQQPYLPFKILDPSSPNVSHPLSYKSADVHDSEIYHLLHSAHLKDVDNKRLIDDASSNFSLDTLMTTFENKRDIQWKSCSQHEFLVKLLVSKRRLLATAEKVVGIACGPLTQGSEPFMNSIIQHSLLLTLKQVLSVIKRPAFETIAPDADPVEGSEPEAGDSSQKPLLKKVKGFFSKNKSSKPEFDPYPLFTEFQSFLDSTPNSGPLVKCFSQDPAYSALDKQVLQSMGCTVLDDPRAFLEVDNNTVLVSIAPNIPVQQIIADIARPLAIVGWRRLTVEGDPPSPRVNNMLDKEYTVFSLRSHDCLGGSEFTMYIRKPKEA